MVASLPAVTLTPRAPFDARPILGYYGRSPLEPLDVVVDGAWRRAVRLGEQNVLFEVASGGTVDAPSLTVRLLKTEPPPPNRCAARTIMPTTAITPTNAPLRGTSALRGTAAAAPTSLPRARGRLPASP